MSTFRNTDMLSLLESIDPQYREFRLLTEDQASKSVQATKNIYNNAPQNVKDAIAQEFPDVDNADAFVQLLRREFPDSLNYKGVKFMAGVARLFLTDPVIHQRSGDFNAALDCIINSHYNDYDRNLNGKGAGDIIDAHSEEIAGRRRSERQAANAGTYEKKSDYDIVRIDSFKQAERYGGYTSWCVTHDEGMFNSYTSQGINQFYFCLRKGFKSIPESGGSGYPLDAYGMSMLAVRVDGDGDLMSCTDRWNDNQNVLNPKELSELIGQNFYEVFKPNNKFKERVAEAIRRVQAGEKPQDVFDYAWSFSDGYALVELGEKCNWIGTDGELLSPNQWFDYAGSFSDGYAWVKLNGKWNWIGTDGELLSPNQWFDGTELFSDGYALVRLMGKTFYIGKDGYLYDRATKNRLGRPEDVAAKLNLQESIRRAIRRYLR